MEKEHYWGDFQSFQLFLCPKELANVSSIQNGVHQFHISIDKELADFKAKLKDLNISYEKTNFDPNKKQIIL